MSILKFPLLYAGSKGEKHLYTLFDSGTKYSCVHPDIIEGIAMLHPLGCIRRLSMSGHALFSEVEYAVILDFYINDVLLSDEFFVVPDLNEEVVMGAATLRKWRIKLNFEDDIVEVDPKVAKLQLI